MYTVILIHVHVYVHVQRVWDSYPSRNEGLHFGIAGSDGTLQGTYMQVAIGSLHCGTSSEQLFFHNRHFAVHIDIRYHKELNSD